jgi:hypothetical protein
MPKGRRRYLACKLLAVNVERIQFIRVLKTIGSTLLSNCTRCWHYGWQFQESVPEINAFLSNLP